MGVIWITGLPGVGKSSAAAAVVALLHEAGERALLLDGDRLRAALAPLGGGYGERDRRRLAEVYANLAADASAQGITAVVATVSLFADVHARNRERFARYLEVLLACDEAERERRRPRPVDGAPEVGRDIPAEWPLAAELRLDSGAASPAQIGARIVARWGEARDA